MTLIKTSNSLISGLLIAGALAVLLLRKRDEPETVDYEALLQASHQRAFSMVTSIVGAVTENPTANPFTDEAVQIIYENETDPETVSLVLASMVAHFVCTYSSAMEVMPDAFWQQWVHDNITCVYDS